MTVLLATDAALNLVLNVTRDAADKHLLSAQKRVAKNAHSAKGACTQTLQTLQCAKEAWDAAREKPASASLRAHALLRERSGAVALA